MENLIIRATRDYNMFINSVDNRDLKPEQHAPLKKKMEKYGYLKAFPVVCKVDGEGNLVVYDGQHRIYFARLFSLPVYYVITDDEFEIAEINSTSKNWSINDFATYFSCKGNKDYIEALGYMEKHNLKITTAFTIMGEHCHGKLLSRRIKDGEFKVTNKRHAYNVGDIYMEVAEMNTQMKTLRFIEALHLVCMINGFSKERFIKNCKRCREKLIPYTRREHYIDMIETIYNYGRRKMLSIKIPIMEYLREKKEESRAKAAQSSAATKKLEGYKNMKGEFEIGKENNDDHDPGLDIRNRSSA